MYKTSPVQVSLTPQEADLLEEPMIVEMTLQPQGSMDVTVKIDDDEYQKHFLRNCQRFFLLTKGHWLSF